MKTIYVLMALFATMIMTAPVLAGDPRIAYAIPYNMPDTSLITNDSFYLSMMSQQEFAFAGYDGSYVLPAVFGGAVVPMTKISFNQDDVGPLTAFKLGRGSSPQQLSGLKLNWTSMKTANDPWMSTDTRAKPMNSENVEVVARNGYDFTIEDLNKYDPDKTAPWL